MEKGKARSQRTHTMDGNSIRTTPEGKKQSTSRTKANERCISGVNTPGQLYILGMVNYLAKYARINMNNIRYNHGILKYDGYTTFLTTLECFISVHYLRIAAFLLAIRR